MHEEPVAFAGGNAPRTGSDLSGPGSVDGLPVSFHPPADFPEPFEGSLRYLAVRLRADVQQQISVTSGGIDQQMDQRSD